MQKLILKFLVLNGPDEKILEILNDELDHSRELKLAMEKIGFLEMSYFGQQYPLYYPQSISGYERVKITTTKQTIMMETEPSLDASLSSVPLVTFVNENLSQHSMSCGRRNCFHITF